ncbi:hypothetical protein WJX73_007244 [Symbiochloris irregularis]|uniref:LNS2/PITP domain-containing protein n=1 Tax=Symbiochloris irregularis TaxID=706552 RepID=A0AAW1NK01_9CHLO
MVAEGPDSASGASPVSSAGQAAGSAASSSHPFSVANPSYLPGVRSGQPAVPTVSAAEAAAGSVGAPAALDGGDHTAIPATTGQEQHQRDEAAPGNRMQLEMIDAHVREGSAAPAAIADTEAHPDESAAQVPSSFKRIARSNDELAAEAASDQHSSSGPLSQHASNGTAAQPSTADDSLSSRNDAPRKHPDLDAAGPGIPASVEEAPASVSHQSPQHDRSATVIARADSSSGLSSSSDGDESAPDDSSLTTSPPRPTQQIATPVSKAGPANTTGLPESTGRALPSVATHSAPATSSYDRIGEDEWVRGRSWDGAGTSAAGVPDRQGGASASTGFPDVELSLCGSQLQPSMSPSEAWDAFARARVSQARWQKEAATLIASPHLYCRMGNTAYPWTEAAPHLVGALAFGPRWRQKTHGLGKGVPLAPPPRRENSAPAGSSGKEGDARRTGWRGWLPSWGGSASHRRRGSTAEPIDMALAAEGSGAQPQLTPAAAAEAAVVAGMRQPGKRRAFVPVSDQLARLPLQPGQNTIDFKFGRQSLSAYLYFLQWDSRLVITDVDGTITRTDVLGHILPRVGLDWSHAGITSLFSHICANGYDILFLSSRAIPQASATRDYLHRLSQNGQTLPSGPVIISPDGLFPSLYRELVLRRPHEFKIRALADIRALFPGDFCPFYAGFGNRDTDEISYLSVGVPASKILIINSKGELRKASSAVATSTWSSLGSIAHLVDMMFPPIPQKTLPNIPAPGPSVPPTPQDKSAATPQGSAAAAGNESRREASRGASPSGTRLSPALAVPPPREEFTDFQFWRVAPPLITETPDDVAGPNADTRVQDDRGGPLSSRASEGLGRRHSSEEDSEEESEDYESGSENALVDESGLYFSPFSSSKNLADGS